jgi:hypothetical protein
MRSLTVGLAAFALALIFAAPSHAASAALVVKRPIASEAIVDKARWVYRRGLYRPWHGPRYGYRWRPYYGYSYRRPYYGYYRWPYYGYYRRPYYGYYRPYYFPYYRPYFGPRVGIYFSF